MSTNYILDQMCGFWKRIFFFCSQWLIEACIWATFTKHEMNVEEL